MNILFLMKSLRFDGGVETSVATLMNTLNSRGHNVYVGALCDEDQNFLKHRLNIDSDNYLFLGSLRTTASYPRKIMQLVRFIKQNNIQLIHTHLFHAGVVGRIAAKASGILSAYTEHSTFYHWWKGHHYFVDRYFAHRTDVLFAVSRSTAATFAARTGIFPDSINVLPNIVDRQRLSRCDIATAAQTICLVGRLEYSKNIYFALNIHRALIQHDPSLKLRIVGTGSLQSEIQDFIIKHDLANNVELIAPQTELNSILAETRLLLMTSHWEGAPMVILEAFASGVPVVATAVPGVIDLVQDGHNGVLLDPDDVDGAAQHIMDLIGDTGRQERLAKNALDALVKHDAEHVVETFETVCQTCYKG